MGFYWFVEKIMVFLRVSPGVVDEIWLPSVLWYTGSWWNAEPGSSRSSRWVFTQCFSGNLEKADLGLRFVTAYFRALGQFRFRCLS